MNLATYTLMKRVLKQHETAHVLSVKTMLTHWYKSLVQTTLRFVYVCDPGHFGVWLVMNAKQTSNGTCNHAYNRIGLHICSFQSVCFVRWWTRTEYNDSGGWPAAIEQPIDRRQYRSNKDSLNNGYFWSRLEKWNQNGNLKWTGVSRFAQTRRCSFLF